MTQNLPRLYKVERYTFEFVLAESVDEAESVVPLLGLKFEETVTEITEMSPKQEGYLWNPMVAKTGEWAEESCGEWLKQTAARREQEEGKTRLRCLSMAKLTMEEQAAILEWVNDTKGFSGS
jgi:hypothetical protein